MPHCSQICPPLDKHTHGGAPLHAAMQPHKPACCHAGKRLHAAPQTLKGHACSLPVDMPPCVCQQALLCQPHACIAQPMHRSCMHSTAHAPLKRTVNQATAISSVWSCSPTTLTAEFALHQAPVQRRTKQNIKRGSQTAWGCPASKAARSLRCWTAQR